MVQTFELESVTEFALRSHTVTYHEVTAMAAEAHGTASRWSAGNRNVADRTETKLSEPAFTIPKVRVSRSILAGTSSILTKWDLKPAIASTLRFSDTANQTNESNVYFSI